MSGFRKPLKSSVAKADPVTPALREAVLRRDGGCVAAKLDRFHECRDMYGTPHRPDSLGRLTLDHVKSELRMGKRAPSDLAHLASLCWAAHMASGWATSNRPALRQYLAASALIDPHDLHVDPVAGCDACHRASRRTGALAPQAPESSR